MKDLLNFHKWNQLNCEYCIFDGDEGKSFIYDLGFAEEELTIIKSHERYCLYIVVNDTADPINGIQERFSTDISFCPKCGRYLGEQINSKKQHISNELTHFEMPYIKQPAPYNHLGLPLEYSKEEAMAIMEQWLHVKFTEFKWYKQYDTPTNWCILSAYGRTK
ncbi:hypothetical protein [Lactobacillus hominis]|uniref:Uncharacterized protein n=1 Tax=Lactobacillus hominis DSM 23910 = CRBIP 24.179 TaxID=1423758 RepID=I7KGV5_9LACO|nr:hypothetical protein [Lactobacillus hominis]MCT3348905.1 hypothetical protein [Lactobacillus hominis]CCI81595.1 Protein of unknown function [Lactobacillus hominis DSM 23910 = CRBIP 24.179]